MKPQRVLALVHKGLEPPDEKVDKTTAQTAEWRMEYDVVRTLKVLGHEVRVIGVHDDLTPIRHYYLGDPAAAAAAAARVAAQTSQK